MLHELDWISAKKLQVLREGLFGRPRLSFIRWGKSESAIVTSPVGKNGLCGAGGPSVRIVWISQRHSNLFGRDGIHRRTAASAPSKEHVCQFGGSFHCEHFARTF